MDVRTGACARSRLYLLHQNGKCFERVTKMGRSFISEVISKAAALVKKLLLYGIKIKLTL